MQSHRKQSSLQLLLNHRATCKFKIVVLQPLLRALFLLVLIAHLKDAPNCRIVQKVGQIVPLELNVEIIHLRIENLAHVYPHQLCLISIDAPTHPLDEKLSDYI